MKKSILVFGVIAIFSLSAFSYMNWNNSNSEVASCKTESIHNSDEEALIPRWENIAVMSNRNLHYQNKVNFIYNIDSRFIWHITKEKLNKAQSIIDIYPEGVTKGMGNFSNIQVTVMKDGEEISAFGDDILLNKEQLDLIKTLDYSSNFYVRANHGKFNYVTGESENYIVYYITVVPEKEAVYSKGNDVLIDYLRTNTVEDIKVVEESKLQPGQIRFTITTDGEVADVNIDSSSGYKKLDKKMVNLIENMPEKWQAATNAKGEKVAQTLIFFYGIEGC